MSITKIWAREILDSRGNPTVEVDLYTARGTELAWTEPSPPPHPHPTPHPTPQCWVCPGLGGEDPLIPSRDGVLGQAHGLDCGGWMLLSRGARIGRPLCSSLVYDTCPAPECLCMHLCVSI